MKKTHRFRPGTLALRALELLPAIFFSEERSESIRSPQIFCSASCLSNVWSRRLPRTCGALRSLAELSFAAFGSDAEAMDCRAGLMAGGYSHAVPSKTKRSALGCGGLQCRHEAVPTGPWKPKEHISILRSEDIWSFYLLCLESYSRADHLKLFKACE